ncbi:MAG: carboxypeptidase regulatory-like domain-containing protein [Acidobacteria bacterium]|nr:carboxypeptidase regulatory-like domain-containing protein [Acidobacteriota bacterium]
MTIPEHSRTLFCPAAPSVPARPFQFHTLILVLLLASIVPAMGASPQGTGGSQKAAKRQEKPYALIFGTVWSPANRPLYGVHLKLRRADQKKPHWELYSDHAGEFAFRVPAGKAEYYVQADLKGYKLSSGKQLQTPPEAKVSIENDERVDIGVHLTE